MENTLCYYNDRAMSFYICQNPQNVQYQALTLIYTMDFGWLWLCQCRFILGKKCTILVRDDDNMGQGGFHVRGSGYMGNLSVTSSQFCYKPKIALKIYRCLYLHIKLVKNKITSMEQDSFSSGDRLKPTTHILWLKAVFSFLN